MGVGGPDFGIGGGGFSGFFGGVATFSEVVEVDLSVFVTSQELLGNLTSLYDGNGFCCKSTKFLNFASDTFVIILAKLILYLWWRL